MFTGRWLATRPVLAVWGWAILPRSGWIAGFVGGGADEIFFIALAALTIVPTIQARIAIPTTIWSIRVIALDNILRF